MGDAYTPGLTVTASTVVRKRRRLPLAGEVLVDPGNRVAATDVVARTTLPGKVYPINFANRLGLAADEIQAALRVAPGEAIAQDQLLAVASSFFGLFKSELRSPITGTFDSVSPVTGQGMLRYEPVPVEVVAYLDGTVVEVLAGEGAVVETLAAMIQGIFGLAGEVNARVKVVAAAPDEALEADAITSECRDRIVVGGARASLAALGRAVEVGAAAVVCGGVAYQDVKELLGYDVGVAVTGTEDIGTTLVVTEGFGDIAMARATYELLRSHDGARASVSGATQIRAGVLRPEIIIPLKPAEGPSGLVQSPSASLGLEVGVSVRCIRAPYFGRIGTVTALPIELETMPSEARVRVVEVRLLNAETVRVPRANVEVIER